MARNSNRGGRRNRPMRNRGSVYSLPIVEPANTVEFDVDVDVSSTAIGTGDDLVANVTYGDLAAGISNAFAGLDSTGFNFPKFRISSLVLDPVSVSGFNPTNLQATVLASNYGAELNLTLSGNHYQFADNDKPLRIRLSSEQGSDGEWKRDFIGTRPASAPQTLSFVDGYGVERDLTSVFCRVQVHLGPAGIGSSTFTWALSSQLHVRAVWTDRIFPSA